MTALSLSSVSLSFGADRILDDISFSVNDGDRVGVIGVNGAGKTSLFRVITGQYQPTSGEIYIQKGHTVGLLEQNPDLTSLPGETSVLEYMYTAHQKLLDAEERIRRTEEALRTSSGEETLRLSAELDRQNDSFRKGGGLEFRSRCRALLLRLGFTEEQTAQKIHTLSGGQYTRLALARLLSTEPDILMLDEPTNHLDIDALTWLEGFISGYKKTVMVISHDRYFLDRTTNKTLHIQFTRARLYPGSYSACKERQEEETASLEKRYREQQKVIARIKANIEFQRRCNREHNFVTIRSKEKQLERMEKIELAPKAPRDIRLSFSEDIHSGNDVITAKDLSFSYSETPLIRNLNFMIKRGERVMFLGPNGSGKSTLMKIMNGRLTPRGGSLTVGYNVKIGYYDQENRGLSAEKTVFEEIHDEYPTKTDLELRSTLALFLFDADDIQRRVSTLSGGERARLTLAKLILKKVNLLILDEPTNHLDIGSCEALENALLAFDGTIIAVSHDRYFINRIATRIIELAPENPRGMYDYPLEDYDDAYTEYMRLRELRRATAEAAAEKAAPSDAKAQYEATKRENALRRSEERKLRRAKERIPELESKIEEIDRELYGSAASDYVRAAELEERKAAAEAELLELYETVM